MYISGMETGNEIRREQLNHVREILLKHGYEVEVWLESDEYGKKSYHKIKPIPLKVNVYSNEVDLYPNGGNETRLSFVFDINRRIKLNESDMNKLGFILCDHLKENLKL